MNEQSFSTRKSHVIQANVNKIWLVGRQHACLCSFYWCSYFIYCKTLQSTALKWFIIENIEFFELIVPSARIINSSGTLSIILIVSSIFILQLLTNVDKYGTSNLSQHLLSLYCRKIRWICLVINFSRLKFQCWINSLLAAIEIIRWTLSVAKIYFYWFFFYWNNFLLLTIRLAAVSYSEAAWNLSFVLICG